MKEFICEICGKNCLRRVKLEDGRKVCEQCNGSLQVNNVLDVSIPEVIKWIGKCSKQGDFLMFIIPQGQRPFFTHKDKYIVVVRKLK